MWPGSDHATGALGLIICQMNKKGLFITFEGPEGSGKTTQIELLETYLKQKDTQQSILSLREPGGVKISEQIRKILLDVKNNNMSSECETLLYLAARAQLVKEVIIPALGNGTIVLCDRFSDSTAAYQGYGNGVDGDAINYIGGFATQGITPDITFLLDMDVAKAFARRNRTKDRIEKRALAYHNRVRDGYLKLAKANPRRIKVIDAEQTKEEIFETIKRYIHDSI